MCTYSQKRDMQTASFIMYAVVFVLVLALSVDASCGGGSRGTTMGIGYTSSVLLLVGVILQGIAQFSETTVDVCDRDNIVVYS